MSFTLHLNACDPISVDRKNWARVWSEMLVECLSPGAHNFKAKTNEEWKTMQESLTSEHGKLPLEELQKIAAGLSIEPKD
eukprot:6139265-Karenia_brevis.AAC.1